MRAEPHPVSFFTPARETVSPSYPVRDHVRSSSSRTLPCVSSSYVATTKCSPSVDPGRALWSLRDHLLLPEAEACVRQHLPDLCVAAAVREEAVGTSRARRLLFSWEESVFGALSAAEGCFRFIFEIFV